MSTLSHLSDRELIKSLNGLVGGERARRVEILEHLNEVDKRKLHLSLGYSSLFEYCVSRLRYSQSAAGRRIATARAMRRFPQIAKMLEAGDVNIATVAMVSRLLTSSNCDQLLSRIRRRSQDDVRAIVAEYRPESATPDRVRPVCVRVAVDSTRTSSSVRSKPDRETGPSPDGHVPAHTMSQPTPTSGSRSQAAPASADTEAPPPSKIERKHELRFLVGSEFMRKFERVKEILSNRNAGAAMEDVFDAAMESFLHANCPLERARRRARKQAGGEIASSHRRDPAGASARRIKAATRDRVHERDHGRCTWVGPGGRRCGATRNLEIDHIVPVAHGGSNAQSNLRLLCRAHNLLAAEQVYGREFMAPFVARE